MRQQTIRTFLLTTLLCLFILCGFTACDFEHQPQERECIATFIVGDETSYARTAYGFVPTYPGGTPTKKAQGSKEFVFTGWSPALGKITEDTTYTAVFEERTRSYEVSVIVTPPGAGEVSGDGVAEHGSKVRLTPKAGRGYRFFGWYENGVPLTKLENSQTVLYNISSDRKIEARFIPISYAIDYCLPDGTINENPTEYDITMGEVTLISPKRNGYVFDGFTTGANGTGERVSKLTYDFVITSPTLYANFVPSTKVTFCVAGGVPLKFEEDFVKGKVLTPPEIDGRELGMSAYFVRGWYIDEECRISADFSMPAETGMTYYAVWEYRGSTGFAPYLEKFLAAKQSGSIQIFSEDELIQLMDFVRFYDITLRQKIAIRFSGGYYPSFGSRQELLDYMETLIDKGEYPNGVRLGYSLDSDPYIPTSIYVSWSEGSVTRTADPDGEGLYTQYEYAHRIFSVGRDADFDAFPIENVAPTLYVETSNQLVYALEHGFRPIPAAGSSAERVYLAARSVLRRIVDDEMNDFQKLRAIYEWLILTVRYDHTAVNTPGIDWRSYDAWYPEGVFFRHAAVCDGIAKSFLILARIENIACVRISGMSKSGIGHAWNKVCFDGAWYGVDATQGNLSVGEEEYLSYTSFLFTDAYKARQYSFVVNPKTATPRQTINVYALMEFYDGTLPYDLYLNGNWELNRLANAVELYTSKAEEYDGVTSHDYVIVEVAVAADSGLTLRTICQRLGVSYYVPLVANGDIQVYVFRLPLAA